MTHRNRGTQGLVFGGLMAALAVICALVPLLSLFLPIPLVLAFVRYGGRMAMLTAAVTVIFSAMFIGPVQALFLLLPAGVLPGLVLGYGFRHKHKPLIIGLATVVVFFVGFVVEYMGARFALLGVNPVDAFLTAMTQGAEPYFTAMQKNYEAMPSSPQVQQQLADLAALRASWPDMVRLLFPSLLFFGGVGFAWINYGLCRLILPRFGHDVPKPTPFAELRLPTWTIWVFSGLLLLLSFAGTRVDETLLWVRVLSNILVPLIYVFVFAGMAVAYGFLRKQNVSKVLSIVIMIMVLFMGSFGVPLYVMVAMFDTVFDIRGLGHSLMGKGPTDNP